jgi:coiled-coil alpha-helical rod protein 1
MLKFEKEILNLKSNNEVMLKENESLKTRFESINEILIIQENQMEPKTPNSASLLYNNEKKQKNILKTWRNKVFELLIKLKNQEIRFKEEKNQIKKTIQETELRLSAQESQYKILQNLFESKKAELSQINAENKTLNEQFCSLKDKNVILTKKIAEDLQSSIELEKSVISMVKKYQNIEETFTLANKKLALLDQRLEFSKNRLGVVKELNNQKMPVLNQEYNRRINLLEMTTNISSIHSSNEPNVSYNLTQNDKKLENFNETQSKFKSEIEADGLKLLQNEIKNIQKERDLLSSKFNSDMDLIKKRMEEMQNGYELVIKNLNIKLKELQESNDLKISEITKVKEELSQKIKEIDELEIKYEDLNNNFNFFKALGQKDILKDNQALNNEKIKEMEENLNDARREQAKALVIMRQMERSNNREKERLEELLRSTDSYYKDYVDKLKFKIVSLEKENNILSNSLKQHRLTKEIQNSDNYLNSIIKINDSKTNWNPQVNNDKFFNNDDKCVNQFNKTSTSDASSFWLDSRKNVNDTDSLINNQEENIDYSNSKDYNKNSEILNQIRKIMGNLEMSDSEDLDENTLKKNDLNNDKTGKKIQN